MVNDLKFKSRPVNSIKDTKLFSHTINPKYEHQPTPFLGLSGQQLPSHLTLQGRAYQLIDCYTHPRTFVIITFLRMKYNIIYVHYILCHLSKRLTDQMEDELIMFILQCGFGYNFIQNIGITN